MPNIKKNKNLTKLPVVRKTTKSKKTNPKKPQTKLLKTPRSPTSKGSAASYYDCLKELVTLPENDRTRITALTHKCKCSKEEIQKAKAEIKHQLVHELARDYKNIGINLGKYVKADIVGCVKDLEN
jgi:hypothetical protein